MLEVVSTINKQVVPRLLRLPRLPRLPRLLRLSHGELSAFRTGNTWQEQDDQASIAKSARMVQYEKTLGSKMKNDAER